MFLYARMGIASLAVFLSLCILPAFANAGASPAQPDKVVFYPDEAQVSVETEAEALTLPSGGKAIVVVLPQGAMRDTFMLSLGGVPAQGYYWPEKTEKEDILSLFGKPMPNFANLPENERSPERKELLEKQLPLAAEAARLDGELRSIQTRLNLLKKSYEKYGDAGGENVSLADEAAKLFKFFAEEYASLQKDLHVAQSAFADAREQLARAQKELSDFDRLHGGDVVVVPGVEGGRHKLQYAYVMPASCRISYRLDARPDKEEFSIDQDVALWQDSGFAWKNVDLYVSTVRRDKTLQPRNINPWEIRLASKVKAAAAGKYQAQESMVMMDALPEAAPAPLAEPNQRAQKGYASAPVLEERATYRVWSLGRRDIAFGTPVNLSLASDSYPAKFHYTLRPVSSPKGFLTADLDLPQPIELPRGMAQFSVDGAVMGRQLFSFDGAAGSIFFGSDPQVTAIVRDLKQTSGEQGFFSKEQTRSWHWEITVKSTRPRPVDVVLEDPAPVKKDEVINLITQSTPRPEEIVNEPKDGGAHVYQWKLSLKPGEPVVVKHQIQVVAPVTPDKTIDPGR